MTKPSDPFSLAVREVFGEYVPQEKVERLRGRLFSEAAVERGVTAMLADEDWPIDPADWTVTRVLRAVLATPDTEKPRR